MGLGLVRTEFLYMNREELPSEDEQYEFFASLVRGMEGRPVTLRTLDVGGDKLPEALAGYAAVGQRQPGAGAARDPPVVARAPAARHPARGDAARRQARPGAHPAAADLDLGRAGAQPRGAGAGGAPAAPPQRADPGDAAAARRDDRGAGRGARRRRAGRRGRFLRDRHQRPDPVHAGDRPHRRAGRAISTTRCTRRCCA